MKLSKNSPCWCGSGKKYKHCHEKFDDMLAVLKLQGKQVPGRELIKTEEDIRYIKKAAKINDAVLDLVGEKIHAGMSTEEIDRIVCDMTSQMGGIAAPLHYDGFPKSVCTSINEVVCHGIPSESRLLQDGDIVNVDVSTIYQGYFSDSSRMFMLGEVAPETKKLVETARRCLDIGLEQVKPWNFLGDMAQAINDYAKSNGYSIVREIGGHGVGLEFHEEPFVSYVTSRGTEMLMVPGMVFTIEPMVNMGKADIYIDDDNGWVVYTEDGKPSAQWEITVAVTEDGYEILTW